MTYQHPPLRVPYVYDDGGRRAAGFRGSAGDCVTRAVAIALELDYMTVYNELSDARAEWVSKSRSRRARDLRNAVAAGRRPARSARNGIPKQVTKTYIAGKGWVWTPTMTIGAGTTVHLRADELPAGRLICQVTRHLCAVIDGVIHDASDPSRDGTRAVYGYWTAPER